MLLSEKFDAEYTASFIKNHAEIKNMFDDMSVPNKQTVIKCRRKNGGYFYSLYNESDSNNKPLVVFLPGYSGSVKQLPDMKPYNCLYVSPLGYHNLESGEIVTRIDILDNTFYGIGPDYSDWLSDVLSVIDFVCKTRPIDSMRIVLSGQSQGGGLALIAGSVLSKTKNVLVCSDQPWLIGFSNERLDDVIYECCKYGSTINRQQIYKNLRAFDPMNYVETVDFPVLLTGSKIDTQSPLRLIEKYYEKLASDNKKLIVYEKRPHGVDKSFFLHMKEFIDFYF